MGFLQKAGKEITEVILATLYFAVWLGVLVLLKKLLLAEYHIQVTRMSVALVGALILAKVVLVMERIPLGAWVREKPRAVEVLLRTSLYAAGVVVVLLVEKAFETRGEYGGFLAALTGIFKHTDLNHVLTNAICVASALVVFNAISVLRRHLGEGALSRVFLTSPSEAAVSPPQRGRVGS